MRETILLDCGSGIFSEIVIGPMEESLGRLLPEDRDSVVIITDANVHRNNRDFVDSHRHIIIGQGESTKTLRLIEDIYRQLLEMGADRNVFLLGMGGGVVTDITGFVAGTYLRGVRFGFVATTLLGQVDACIGGKNGVNLDGYKNIIGLISQPEFVVCDIEKLRTLPEREFRSGMGEIVKAGIIGDAELFSILEKYGYEGVKGNPELLADVIVRAIKVKVAIVAADEHEKGERRKLNMGHTFAHALEKIVPGTAHGEAVAAGIVMISRVAVKTGKLTEGDSLRITDVVSGLGLPVEYPVELKKLFSAIKYDKKREGDIINVVLPTGIGSCEVIPMPVGELEELSI